MFIRARTAKRLIVSLATFFLSCAAHAEVSLPQLLSDGIVLQRDAAAMLWGWADDGEKVVVLLDGEEVATTAAENGRWALSVGPVAAGGPHRIDVIGDNRVVVNDVYFGDVWVASGQSNMEMPLRRVREKFASEIDAADFPLIRHFTVPIEYDFTAPREDLNGGKWLPATSESIAELSAVGFFFARSLHATYEVPIGIVASSRGGAAAESWMSEAALGEYPHYLEVARRYQDADFLQAVIAADEAVIDAWHGGVHRDDKGLAAGLPWYASDIDDSDWDRFAVPGHWADTPLGELYGSFWLRRTIDLPDNVAGQAGLLRLGRIVDSDTSWVNGREVGNTTYDGPPRDYTIPPGVLKAGRNVIAVRIVNSTDASGHGGMVHDKPYHLQVGNEQVDLQGDWRFRVGTTREAIKPRVFVPWKPPLGFYNAMLAPLLNMTIKGVIWYQGETNAGRPQEYEHLFRSMIRNWRDDWGQGDFPFLFVQLANFLPSSPQPQESSWAATRQAQAKALAEPNTAMAVAIDVGEWNDIHPLDKKTVAERLALAARAVAYGDRDVVYSGPMIRSAVREGDSVVLGFNHVGGGLSAHGDVLQGFAVAGVDGRFAWADAVIDGDTVVLTVADGMEPLTVRYAWADNPDNANLYNDAGLPAAPFEIVISKDP